jgi:Protein of unknown function (DUF1236)
MKKSLMATVAAVAVVGFATLAVAQAPNEGDKGAANPQGAPHEQKVAPGGATMHPQGGAQSTEKTLAPQSSQSAQGTGEGAKPGDRMGQGGPAAKDQKGTMPERGAQDQSGKSGANASEQHANKAPASRGGSVQLSQDQRTKIQTVIGKGGAPVTTNVNFNVSVGATVPRSVHVEVLPEDVVEIVPQYEGFDYIIVGDEILIVDPDTLAIVAIIPA